MPIVLGIFDTKNHAEDAVLSLVQAGFERFDVRLSDDVPGLIEQGLAEEDAECYAEGIRRGRIVVGVRCFPDGIDRAAEVMRKLGAVDVSPRRDLRAATGERDSNSNARIVRAGQQGGGAAGLPSVYSIVMRTVMLNTVLSAETMKKHIDFHLKPPVEHIEMFDWMAIDEAAGAGARGLVSGVARREIEEVKSNAVDAEAGERGRPEGRFFLRGQQR